MARMKVKLGKMKDFFMPVQFNAHDGEEMEMKFKVRHMKRDEFLAQMQAEGSEKLDDTQFIMMLASDWDLEEKFNEENVKELVELFPAITLGLTQEYLTAMVGQRVKN